MIGTGKHAGLGGARCARGGIKVGFLTQEDDWHRNRTPAEELAAWDLDEIRASGLLRDADLVRPFGRLSVGQRRRVALARILLSRPSALLFAWSATTGCRVIVGQPRQELEIHETATGRRDRDVAFAFPSSVDAAR